MTGHPLVRQSATAAGLTLFDCRRLAREHEEVAGMPHGAISDREAYAVYQGGKLKRAWWWAPWKLTNPLWPWFWRGGDEHGRSTVVIQPPLLGAFIFPTSAPCETCATEGECDAHR